MPPSPGLRALKLQPNAKVGGKYRLLQRIALGGMGEIWAAENESTSAKVALKVVRSRHVARPEVVGRLRHEARIGAMLTHRNIVRVFDLVESDGVLALVMELLRGETLGAFLDRRKKLSEAEGAAIALAILAGLEHAHDQGIIHRDLKPANIYLAVDPDGHVTPKVLDFGIARLPKSTQLTLEGCVLGTPSYMSPEQIRAEVVDGRSDIFAVGVLLHEMLTGKCPFEAVTPQAALASVLETTIDPDPSVDPRLWLLVQRALAKRPYERFGSAREFAQALRAAMGDRLREIDAVLNRELAARVTEGATDAQLAETDPGSLDGIDSSDHEAIHGPQGAAAPLSGPRARSLRIDAPGVRGVPGEPGVRGVPGEPGTPGPDEAPPAEAPPLPGAPPSPRTLSPRERGPTKGSYLFVAGLSLLLASLAIAAVERRQQSGRPLAPPLPAAHEPPTPKPDPIVAEPPASNDAPSQPAAGASGGPPPAPLEAAPTSSVSVSDSAREKKKPRGAHRDGIATDPGF